MGRAAAPPRTSSVEGILQSEVDPIDVVQERSRFERLRHQLVVDHAQPIGWRGPGRRRPGSSAAGALTRRWPTPQSLLSRLPKFRMSARNWKRVALAAQVLKRSCATLKSMPPDHRQEHRVALRVLAAMLAEVAVLADVGVPGRGLLGGGERADGRRGGDGLEVHLRLVARDVDQVVGRAAVAVQVAREGVARVAAACAPPRRTRTSSPPNLKYSLRVGARQEEAVARRAAE